MKLLTAAAVLCLAAAPVLAGQCPADIAKIDAALEAGTPLSDEERAQVQQWRDEGQDLHDAGDHDASVQTLAMAKEALGID